MSDEETDPSTSLSNANGNTSEERCEHCGTSVETEEWYPVSTERKSDGTLRFYSFCCEDCRKAWVDERSD